MLLFDENLSYRLVVALSDIYPHSVHVRDVGLVGATDEAVWDYAIRHHLVITSKDIDFYQRSILRGAPPKIIWLQIGNASTTQVIIVLRREFSHIQRFLKDAEAAFLRLGLDSDA